MESSLRPHSLILCVVKTELLVRPFGAYIVCRTYEISVSALHSKVVRGRQIRRLKATNPNSNLNPKRQREPELEPEPEVEHQPEVEPEVEHLCLDVRDVPIEDYIGYYSVRYCLIY